jgi:hypothetical protein
MTALVVPSLFALVLARALGGSFGGWTGVRLRWPWLILVPFPVLFALFNPPLETQPWAIAWGTRLWQAAQVALVIGLLRNMLDRRGVARAPWAIAATGVALNALVIFANGGYMPVSPDAPAWVLAKATGDHLHNTAVMTDTTPLSFLGDVLLQPAWIPPRPNVLSIGDVLLSSGVAGWVFLTTRRRTATL